METLRLHLAFARFIVSSACALALAGCATTRDQPAAAGEQAAERSLREARSARLPVEQRAAYLLAAAERAASQLAGSDAAEARKTYNAAVAELTVLLRSADGGRHWDRPLAASAAGTGYRLRFASGSRQNGTWPPTYFDFFRTPARVNERSLRTQVREQGIGGVLVGIHRPPNPREEFLPESGVAAPVTAVLDFKRAGGGGGTGRDVVLSLYDPTRRDSVRLDGATRPLAADFTAPLAYYPNPPFLGIMEALRVDRYFKTAGLSMLQPYDPERIPVVFVHGLASAPGMWGDTIAAVESDPELRGRFQFWVFGYPTGDPISISALQLREALEGVYRGYPRTKDMVLISHSLGGLLSKMQSIDSERGAWDAIFGADADRLHAKVPPDGTVKRALIFKANPRVKRIVFICVPHRGSPLADNFIGAAAISLIHLPAGLLDGIRAQVGHSIAVAAGRKGFVFPPSVHGLSQKSPLLISLDRRPMRAPHHSIIGDRGKGDSPKSTDGVVPYRSSHLDSAASEIIVPGPHGSHRLPQTIRELQRILRLEAK